MKPTGYWPCRNEIINAHLSAPHKYEPFTELFDTEKLGEIRSKYGVDLYKECYTDALYEVVEAANVTAHLRLLGGVLQAHLHSGRLPRELYRCVFPGQRHRASDQ